MSRFFKASLSGALVLAFATLAGGTAWADGKYSGVGRPATRAEIHAWDIDVRPDFKGLRPGSGSVDQGQEVWEAKCASCHGSFGESNEVHTPLIGGTTKDDIKTGHVLSLVKGDAPQRSAIMKVATVSTLFDYINRAMPPHLAQVPDQRRGLRAGGLSAQSGGNRARRLCSDRQEHRRGPGAHAQPQWDEHRPRHVARRPGIKGWHRQRRQA
jgi:mono/diheme cytochrome c family protein